jgi:hypothetical protein
LVYWFTIANSGATESKRITVGDFVESVRTDNLKAPTIFGSRAGAIHSSGMERRAQRLDFQFAHKNAFEEWLLEGGWMKTLTV